MAEDRVPLMADIFISYSSKHRDLTENLAALLRKHTVWWDYNLESWGSYQKQIDTAIQAASVVVAIWSEGAATSTYVLGEANQALNAGKLINARAPDFPISMVPTPYNALQIEPPRPHRAPPAAAVDPRSVDRQADPPLRRASPNRPPNRAP